MLWKRLGIALQHLWLRGRALSVQPTLGSDLIRVLQGLWLRGAMLQVQLTPDRAQSRAWRLPLHLSKVFLAHTAGQILTAPRVWTNRAALLPASLASARCQTSRWLRWTRCRATRATSSPVSRSTRRNIIRRTSARAATSNQGRTRQIPEWAPGRAWPILRHPGTAHPPRRRTPRLWQPRQRRAR